MFQPQQQQQQQEVQLATWIRDTYSPDAQARQSAEGRITAARDGNPGLYFELLLGIIENRSGFYGADQRQSAALLLRQGFDSRDRLSRGGENIKERVIEQALLEATQPVYAQLSEAVARLVRALYPAKWPTVLNTLCDVLQSTAAAAAQQLHALDLLNRAVKAVGSMRLGTGAKHFAASGTAARTLTLAHSIFTHSLTVPGVGSDNGGSACTAAVLALRLARNTALYGVGNYGTSAEFGGFFKDACTLVAALAQGNAIGGNGGSQSAGPVEFSGKLVQSVLKTLRKAMKRRPDAFVPYLSATLELVAGVIRSEAPCCRTERTVIFAYRVIAQTLVRSAEKGYKLELHKGTTAQPPAWLVAGSQAIKAFFTGERLREIITVSITRHMVLTDAELMQSVQDPEAFMELEEAGSYKTSRAACVQHTLSVILEAFPGAFAAPLTEFLSDALRVSPNSLQAVLAKDAVYAAVGVAAYELADAIPFDQVIPRWIEEIAYVDPAYASVPRRRLAWLLGNVISANMQAPPLVLAYKFLVPLLSDPDLSVAFTAAASIHARK